MIADQGPRARFEFFAVQVDLAEFKAHDPALVRDIHLNEGEHRADDHDGGNAALAATPSMKARANSLDQNAIVVFTVDSLANRYSGVSSKRA